MNVTGTGIAVALAVIIALAFLFFGSSVLMPFTSGQPVALDQTATTTMEVPAMGGQELPTTLTITDEVVGTGAEATNGSTVSVNYTGMLPDGTVFDSSVGKAPLEFELGAGRVIAGWEQGILGMKVGGKRSLIIPPDMGYGAQDYGPIPGNSTLLFEVELIDVR